MRAFPIHPGSIPTDVAWSSGFLAELLFPDKVKLASACILYLAAEKADWLSRLERAVRTFLLPSSRVPEIPAEAYEKIRVRLLAYHGEWKEKVLRGNGLLRSDPIHEGT